METIIMIRHGEKPKLGLGQLNSKGLNRSLALPKYFLKNYQKADYIFAPDPTQLHYEHHGDKKKHFYIRPLATIEPTAILLNLPVNLSIGVDNYQKLVTKLLKDKYHNSVIYVAWEHSQIIEIAKHFFSIFKVNDIHLPDWDGDDYDTVFIFNINWNTHKLDFKIAHQNL